MAKDLRRQFSATSVADIAFLVLVFFLVATTIDIDTSLYRSQSLSSDQPSSNIKEQSVLAIPVNSFDQLLDNDNQIHLSMNQQKTKEFIINPQNKENQLEKKIESIESFEEIDISNFRVMYLYSVNYPCIVSLNL